MTLKYDRIYLIETEKVRYIGNSVFPTFESLDRSKVYQVPEFELEAKVKETAEIVEGTIEGYLVPTLQTVTPTVAYQPAARPV